MPLSPPAERELVHDRTVVCRGWRRTDGHWDIEGHLVDTKAYGFPNEYKGFIEPGQAIHDMWLRLTIDRDLNIVAVEAVTDSGPFPICPDIAPNFQRLVGLSIGTGWRRAVRERLGGAEGCTHLVELLGPLATTAYQTIFGERAREPRHAAARGAGVPPAQAHPKPRLLNSCHAFAESSPVVARIWPRWFRPPTDGSGSRSAG